MSAAVSAALEFAERSPASTRTRVITWQDPLPTAAAGAELAGLDYMRAAAAADLPPPPIAVLLRMAPVEIEDGRVVFEGEPGEEHYNPIGVVHGGYAATLLDSAIGCAVHTTLPAGVAYSTADAGGEVRAGDHPRDRDRPLRGRGPASGPAPGDGDRQGGRRGLGQAARPRLRHLPDQRLSGPRSSAQERRGGPEAGE